jgi:hypothetical protein
MAAQEFALVSPAAREEFLIQYQLQTVAEFSLAVCGCCEKIGMLCKTPNLRRITVTPPANTKQCSE